jgi:hypothetical protein
MNASVQSNIVVHAPHPYSHFPPPGSWIEPWDGKKSIIPDITLDYGPVDQLARLFQKAEAAAHEAGVWLSFAPLEAMLDVNRNNSRTWRPLVPLFIPEIGGVTPETGLCILARNRQGEVVATQAARLYTWTNTNLKAEAESLRMFYRDPQSSRGATEECRVSAPSATNISGKVVFSGGTWFRPDFRGRGLMYSLPRLSKAVALTRWYSDYTLTVMAESVVNGGTDRRAGYNHMEWDVELIDTPVGSARFALLWTEREALLEYLLEFLDRPDPQVDAVVDYRTA